MATVFVKILEGRGIKYQILAGFLALVIIFTFSSLYNIYTISKSRKTLSQLFEDKEPSVDVLNDFKVLIIRSRMLTTNWVYLRKNPGSKEELKKIQNKEYKIIKSKLKQCVAQWDDTSQVELLKDLYLDYDNLLTAQREVQALLPNFESYDDPMSKFQAEDLLENEVEPLSEKLLLKLNQLINKKTKEKNLAKISLNESFYSLSTNILILGLALVILGLLASTIIASRITKPIKIIRDAIVKLSRGEQPSVLGIKSRDEIGQMSNSVNILLGNLKQQAVFASEIGSGNFDATFSPLSENDELGFALSQMREKLKQAANEEFRRNWVNNGIVKLDELVVKAESNSQKWFNDILTFILAYTSGYQGALYLLNEENDESVNLKLVASYGYTDNLQHEIQIGDGIIGQVFLKKKTYTANELLNSTNEIEDKSTSYLAMPLNTSTGCYGVIVFVTENNFIDYQIQFIKRATESLAYTVSFILNNAKIKRLLDVSIEQQRLLIIKEEQLEENLKQLQISREQAVKAKEKAEEALVVKTQFLSVMSHEIRTPMNAVIGITNLLLEGNPKPEQLETMNVLKFSANNLLHLINDILDFSKIDSGKIVLEKIEFSLFELLNNVKKSFEYKAKEKNIEINLIFENQIHDYLIGDPIRIAQILNNLVNNAVKFTEKGKVDIKVYQSIIEESTKVLFKVEDTGIGIESDKLDLIFENFTQASSDTTRKYGGTGLGLAITKKLVELMDSSISVASEFGKGSCFSFELALQISNNERNVISVIQNENIDLSGKHILLVEDNETNVMVACRYLKKWNATFDVAENGLLAVQKAKESYYDSILMDLQMPVMDGYDATKQIRTFNSEIPIIAMTAEAIFDIKEVALEAGVNDFVAKPFDAQFLLNLLIKYTKKSNTDNRVEIIPNEVVELPQEKVTKSIVSFAKYLELVEGDNDFLVQILSQTLSDYKQAIETLQKLYIENDTVSISRLAHKLKPSIQLLGINQISLMFSTLIERMNKFDENSNLALQDLFNFINQTIDEIATKIKETNEL